MISKYNRVFGVERWLSIRTHAAKFYRPAPKPMATKTVESVRLRDGRTATIMPGIGGCEYTVAEPHESHAGVNITITRGCAWVGVE